MDTTNYLRHLGSDGPTLLSLAEQDPKAGVPTCPPWDLAKLLAHVGSAHRWAEEIVRTRAMEFCPFSKPPKEFDAVCQWYEEGVEMLLGTLNGVSPDEPVWNWLDMGPAPAGFWPRRMAHETAVHRWDAENSLGSPRPIDTDLALDGIDEYLTITATSISMKANEALAGRLGLAATDAPLEVTLTLSPGAIHREEGLEAPDAVVRATSSDLLLWLVGRRSADDETVASDGDRSVIETWTTVRF